MNASWARSTAIVWRGVMALVAVAGGAAWAQTIENLAVARTYGAGVHAYFSGDFDRCYDELTAAIEAGSEDPRTRYFRGLAAPRLGRLDEAEADFTDGAELESRAIGSWSVSRSLERVQGHDRIQLERHRVRARVAAVQRERAAARERFIDSRAAEPEVLRRRRPAALPAPAADAANPFADQPAAGADSVERPTAPAPEPAPAGEQLEPAMELPSSTSAEAPAAVPADVPAEPAPPAAEPDAPAAETVPAAEAPFDPFEPAAEPAPAVESTEGQ